MTVTIPMKQNRKAKILVVDDDKIVLRAASEILSREGYQVVAMDDAVEGLAACKDPSIEVACLNIKMPNLSGMDLLKAFKQSRADIEVIMMTAFATVETAVEAVKGGAYDYLTKPFENVDLLTLAVGRAVEKKALRDRTKVLEEALAVVHEQLEVEELPQEIRSSNPKGVEVLSLAHLPYSQAKKLAMRAFEQRYLSALLDRSGNNVSSAARAAGVDRSNFRRLLKQYEVGGRSMKGSDARGDDEGDFEEAAS